MTCNNPKLDLVNIKAYTKFGEILSICNNSKLDLVNIMAYIKFGEIEEILSICSQYIDRNGINYYDGQNDGRTDGRYDGQPKSNIAPLFQSEAKIRLDISCELSV